MKSEFINCLHCSAGWSDNVWILDSPLFYYSELLGVTVHVPTGFVTDFASVYRLPVIFLCFGSRAHHEAVVHDYLCRKDSKPVVGRRLADRVFLEAMKVRKKPFYLRWPMYCGVRAGGWTSYHRKTVFFYRGENELNSI